MGLSGGFPIDIILFGMIAAFLVLRLRGILGRRTGYEHPPQPIQPREAMAPATPAAPPVAPVRTAPRTLPAPTSPVGQSLTAMAAIDRGFDPRGFLDGAEKAFQIIVHAFAAGDRAALRPLLGQETWHAFDAAITEREKEGHTHVSDIRAIHALTIEDASLRGSVASITTRIVSDQVNMTHGRDGHTIMGTDAVTEINDLWTFEHDLSRGDPAWHLVAARSA